MLTIYAYFLLSNKPFQYLVALTTWAGSFGWSFFWSLMGIFMPSLLAAGQLCSLVSGQQSMCVCVIIISKGEGGKQAVCLLSSRKLAPQSEAFKGFMFASCLLASH